MSAELHGNTTEERLKQMTKAQRYYYLHREEKNAKRLEIYHNDPKTIAKREERERKRAEKEAEKEQKKLQQKEEKKALRAKKAAEMVQLATKTSRVQKKKIEGPLADFILPAIGENNS